MPGEANRAHWTTQRRNLVSSRYTVAHSDRAYLTYERSVDREELCPTLGGVGVERVGDVQAQARSDINSSCAAKRGCLSGASARHHITQLSTGNKCNRDPSSSEKRTATVRDQPDSIVSFGRTSDACDSHFFSQAKSCQTGHLHRPPARLFETCSSVLNSDPVRLPNEASRRHRRRRSRSRTGERSYVRSENGGAHMPTARH